MIISKRCCDICRRELGKFDSKDIYSMQLECQDSISKDPEYRFHIHDICTECAKKIQDFLHREISMSIKLPFKGDWS